MQKGDDIRSVAYRADATGEAFHGQKVFRGRAHHAQIVEHGHSFVGNFGFVRDESLHSIVHPVIINSEFGCDESGTFQNVIFSDEYGIHITGGFAGIECENHGSITENTDFPDDAFFTQKLVQPTQSGQDRFFS